MASRSGGGRWGSCASACLIAGALFVILTGCVNQEPVPGPSSSASAQTALQSEQPSNTGPEEQIAAMQEVADRLDCVRVELDPPLPDVWDGKVANGICDSSLTAPSSEGWRYVVSFFALPTEEEAIAALRPGGVLSPMSTESVFWRSGSVLIGVKPTDVENIDRVRAEFGEPLPL